MLGLLVLVIILIVTFFCSVRPWLMERDRKERLHNGKVFQAILKEDKEGFNKELGDRNIFGLLDTKSNTIYHQASTTFWTVNMTSIVMNKANKEGVEAGLINKRTEIFKQTKCPPALVSK